MRAHYLIVYDIVDPKRLQKVAKILENFGERVQKSVFEAFLDQEQLRALTSSLARVGHDDDGIKIFSLCETCRGKRRGVGIMRECLPDAPWRVL